MCTINADLVASPPDDAAIDALLLMSLRRHADALLTSHADAAVTRFSIATVFRLMRLMFFFCRRYLSITLRLATPLSFPLIERCFFDALLIDFHFFHFAIFFHACHCFHFSLRYL